MPLSAGLVVKNGSKAFADDLGRHAGAGVGDGDHDILPGRHFGVAGGIGVVEMAVGRLDGQAAAVRHGVAPVDREVQDGVLELARIGEGPPQAAGQHGLDRDRFAERAPQQVGHAGDDAVGVDDLRRQRLLAREGEQPGGEVGGARRAASVAASTNLSMSVSPRDSLRWIRFMALMMIASMLLKSCAMPPVSWPTASIFCIWRICASAAWRVAISSRSARSTPSALHAPQSLRAAAAARR